MHPFSTTYFQGVEKGCIGNEWVKISEIQFRQYCISKQHVKYNRVYSARFIENIMKVKTTHISTGVIEVHFSLGLSYWYRRLTKLLKKIQYFFIQWECSLKSLQIEYQYLYLNMIFLKLLVVIVLNTS